MNENEHRAILGGGCITLVVAVLMLAIVALCSLFDSLLYF